MSRRGGAARGAAAGFLGLVALHAVGSTKGAKGRIADAFADVAGLIERALDPSAPAIPDRRAGAKQNEAAAGVAAGRAKGGATGGLSDRITDRLPIPDPPN